MPGGKVVFDLRNSHGSGRLNYLEGSLILNVILSARFFDKHWYFDLEGSRHKCVSHGTCLLIFKSDRVLDQAKSWIRQSLGPGKN